MHQNSSSFGIARNLSGISAFKPICDLQANPLQGRRTFGGIITASVVVNKMEFSQFASLSIANRRGQKIFTGNRFSFKGGYQCFTSNSKEKNGIAYELGRENLSAVDEIIDGKIELKSCTSTTSYNSLLARSEIILREKLLRLQDSQEDSEASKDSKGINNEMDTLFLESTIRKLIDRVEESLNIFNNSDEMNKTDQSSTTIVPNSDTYLHIFNIYALASDIRKGNNDYPGKAIHLLNKLEENSVGLWKNMKYTNDDTIPLVPVIPRTEHYNSVIKAFANSASHSKGAEFRAQNIIDGMEKLQHEGSSPSFMWANSTTYNNVIEAWVKGEMDGVSARRAQEVFVRMMDATCHYNTDETKALDTDAVEPNLYTYSLMITAWSRCDSFDAPFNATQHLTWMEAFCKRLNCEIQSESADVSKLDKDSTEHEKVVLLTPSICDYENVLSAWSKSKARIAARRATMVLRGMEDRFRSGESHVRPSGNCYKSFLRTLNNEDKDRSQMFRHILREMLDQFDEGYEDMEPSDRCIVSVLSSWAENGAMVQEDVKQLLHRVESLQNNANEANKPSSEAYVNLVRCWANLKSEESALQCEKALLRIEQMWDNEYESFSKERQREFLSILQMGYSSTIKSWSSSEDSDKLNKALFILRHIDERCKIAQEKGALACVPNTSIYNAVLHVCVHTNRSEKQKMDAFRVALKTVRALQNSHSADANSKTYELMLHACYELLPKGKARDNAARTIFENATRDGRINDSILNHLRSIISIDLYNTILREHANLQIFPEGPNAQEMNEGNTDIIDVDKRLVTLQERAGQKILRAGRLL